MSVAWLYTSTMTRDENRLKEGIKLGDENEINDHKPGEKTQYTQKGKQVRKNGKKCLNSANSMK